MIGALLEPFAYDYMNRAMLVCALIGLTGALLSCYLILKGWSLMGDALAHAVVPGVAVAYVLAAPFALGAFIAGGLAAGGMALLRQQTRLREDTIIGLVFTSFFAGGLLLTSINPVAVNLNAIILGNALALSDQDIVQLIIICAVALLVLAAKWRDFLLLFFDAAQARASGLPLGALRVLFFALLSAVTVAALQAVGACLVIAMVITPGATAFLLTPRFAAMLPVAAAIGGLTGALGVYLSYFLDGATGGVIVLLQTLVFLAVFFARGRPRPQAA